MSTSIVIWLRRVIEDFGEKQGSATPILCNKSAIPLSKNPVYYSSAKIALKFHYIIDGDEEKEVVVVYCNTEDQVGGIFTKALPNDRFIEGLLGVKKQSIKESVKLNAFLV